MSVITCCVGENIVGTVIDLITMLAALGALAFSFFSFYRNRWVYASDFLKQVDSKEMRENRQIVYRCFHENDNDIGWLDLIESNVELKAAITSVIAFYDGAAHMVFKNLIPKRLFSKVTLFTASEFFKIVLPYIKYRRGVDRDDTTRENQKDFNPLYAYHYVRLMNDFCIRRKLKRIKNNTSKYNKQIEKCEKKICKITQNNVKDDDENPQKHKISHKYT